MTRRQIEWASLHDWFCGVGADNASVIVEDRYTVNGGPLQVDILTFSNFAELYVWAGY